MPPCHYCVRVLVAVINGLHDGTDNRFSAVLFSVFVVYQFYVT